MLAFAVLFALDEIVFELGCSRSAARRYGLSLDFSIVVWR